MCKDYIHRGLVYKNHRGKFRKWWHENIYVFMMNRRKRKIINGFRLWRKLTTETCLTEQQYCLFEEVILNNLNSFDLIQEYINSILDSDYRLPGKYEFLFKKHYPTLRYLDIVFATIELIQSDPTFHYPEVNSRLIDIKKKFR